MTLPEEECAFYFAAMAQLDPELRPVFIARVANTLGAYSPFCELGPGDVDRAIRAAFEALWVPPPDEATKNASRWNRSASSFEKVSKIAQPVEEKRRRRPVAGHGYVPA
jgi:hypothetical protein